MKATNRIRFLTTIIFLCASSYALSDSTPRDAQWTKYGNCMQVSQHAYKQVDKMAGPGTRWYFDRRAFPGELRELESRMDQMFAAHAEFVTTFSDDQRLKLESRLWALSNIESDVKFRLDKLDLEIRQAKPDGRRVLTNTNHLREDVRKWRKEHTKIAKQLNLRSGD